MEKSCRSETRLISMQQFEINERIKCKFERGYDKLISIFRKKLTWKHSTMRVPPVNILKRMPRDIRITWLGVLKVSGDSITTYQTLSTVPLKG